MSLLLNKENLSRLPSSRSSSLSKSKTASHHSRRLSQISDTSSVISLTGIGKTQELKDAFKKFDNREISKDEFVSVIQNDIGIQTNKEFEQKISRPDVKYTDIVKALHINKPKERTSYQSAVNPLAGDFRKFKKNVEAQPSVGTNPKREELVVNNVRGLLSGEISKDQFIEKLKNNDMPIEKISKELRNFDSSHQERFKDFGVKIMRELHLSSQLAVGDNPNQMNMAYLSASKDFVQIPTIQDRLSTEQIDQFRKQKEERIFISATGEPVICSTRIKGPAYIKANKTNGNILTWGESSNSAIKDECKASQRKKTETHRDKITSVQNLLSDNCKGPVYDNIKNPQTKIMRWHQSTFTFHDF